MPRHGQRACSSHRRRSPGRRNGSELRMAGASRALTKRSILTVLLHRDEAPLCSRTVSFYSFHTAQPHPEAVAQHQGSFLALLILMLSSRVLSKCQPAHVMLSSTFKVSSSDIDEEARHLVLRSHQHGVG